MRGKANCCCPARMQHSVLYPRFRDEDGSGDLPVRFGAARSLALMAGSRPLSGTANKSPPVAASTRDHGCCCRGRWRVPRCSSPRRLPGVEVVHTRGGGTRVLSIMALRMPVFLFIVAVEA